MMPRRSNFLTCVAYLRTLHKSQLGPQANMTPVEYFGEQLRKAGYNYYGTEPLYSGITGEEFDVCVVSLYK